jgi:hypothetical protein
MQLLGFDPAVPGADTCYVAIYSTRHNGLLSVNEHRAWDVDRLVERLRQQYGWDCIVQRVTEEEAFTLRQMQRDYAQFVRRVLGYEEAQVRL